MSAQPVDTLRYALDADIAPFRARAGQLDAEASRLGDSIKAKTGNAFDGATAGASKLSNQLKLTANQYQAFAREAKETGKSVDSLIQAHFRGGSAAEAAGKKSVAALAAERAAIQATAREARIAAEEALRRQRAASPNAVPLRGHQITNLSQQVQDWFVGFGSGQTPLTILLQQAPQTVSAVGGIGNAFKLMGGAAGVARIAVGGLAVGGLAAFVAASVPASEASAKIEMGLRLTGNAAGLSRERVRDLANELNRTSSLPPRRARWQGGLLPYRITHFLVNKRTMRVAPITKLKKFKSGRNRLGHRLPSIN